MSRRIDITGQRFGDLEVIELSNERNEHKTRLWKCKCHACGEITYVAGTSLRAGYYKSCGCIQPLKRDLGAKKHIESDKVDGTRKTALKAKLHSGNKSGHKGVIWLEDRQQWKAYIGFQGKTIHLGYRISKEEAIALRAEAEEKYHHPYIEDGQEL
ncbi:HNH endonuclease [Cohnella sp. AR92]|uniref:HNH endonuclease n=1 Tax=Cohnella sp. AR92 TaxID=648716 RepID=UPI000F8D6A88|nr:HNH endonuclease [Cohnella sp. AR92]RUS47576.1 HNH endonuclease [Cohnella sp. AR92]